MLSINQFGRVFHTATTFTKVYDFLPLNNLTQTACVRALGASLEARHPSDWPTESLRETGAKAMAYGAEGAL